MTAVDKGISRALSPQARSIADFTGAKIRVFLTEVAEGVSNYRSLHSLTEQVEHQYHGRFLIELIQNAHDALGGTAPGKESRGRIAIVFDEFDSTFGSLLVANDGEPFTASNFERLSQLGQSDKDPQESIGNKGIGFRSVLEVTRSPEIHSRSSRSSKSFDGYCFSFRPTVLDALEGPVTQLAFGSRIPASPIDSGPLVDWSPEMVAKLRRRATAQSETWLRGEVRFLSPYLLPIPVIEPLTPAVKKLEADGYATVVRLPLAHQRAHDLVVRELDSIEPSITLFLERVEELIVRTAPDKTKRITRQESRSSMPKGREVRIRSAGEEAVYLVWDRLVRVAEEAEDFQAAVAALPGRWPELKEVPIALAVRKGMATPEIGRFSIYLPTMLHTGSGAHINAPFFGELSRKTIPFSDPYNKHLLDVAMDVVVDAVRGNLAGRSEEEACAIVDLLAPQTETPSGELNWKALLNEAFARAGASLDDEPLFLSDTGWEVLRATSLLPAIENLELFQEDLFRQYADFCVFHQCLNSRKRSVEAIAVERFDTGAYPRPEDIASTAARVAAALRAEGGDWNAFWRDVMELLEGGQEHLLDYEVVLGQDGELHNARSGKVFFLPRQGVDEDLQPDADISRVPESLRASIAFLSEAIAVYEEDRPNVQTAVRAYLADTLVLPFRVESILNGALLDLVPELPHALDGPKSELCRDVLDWGLRLAASLRDRGRGTEALARALRALPVPCAGGWHRMGDASFGRGWIHSVGEHLHAYLHSVKSDEGKDARRKLLLGPRSRLWSGNAELARHLLVDGGVVDGLRLIPVVPEAWPSRFRARSGDFSLPEDAPTSLSRGQWAAFRSSVNGTVRPPFSTYRPYRVEVFYVLPGLSEHQQLPEAARTALSELIFRSLPGWEPALTLVVKKTSGDSNVLQLRSPLAHFLRSSPWMRLEAGDVVEWARPGDRWHVPADALAGRIRQFAYLQPITIPFARRIEEKKDLAKALYSLGLPRFDVTTETDSPRLIEAISNAVGSDDAPDPNILLGHVREAWACFKPSVFQPPLQRLAIRREGRLELLEPTTDAPVLVPDLGTYADVLEKFGLPVLPIRPADAKSLRDWFRKAYGERIVLTSELAVAPSVDGDRWINASAPLLQDTDVSWLIGPLLTVVAFFAQGRGVHSPGFIERALALRDARFYWADSLSVNVLRHGRSLASSDQAAFWDGETETLLATKACRSKPALLSRALAELLGREDLDVPIRLLLSPIADIEEEPADIAGLLEALQISPEKLIEVSAYLRGDVSHMARLVHAYLTTRRRATSVTTRRRAISAQDDGALDAGSEEELAALMQASGVSDGEIAQVLAAAKNSIDLFAFGRTLAADLLDRHSLKAWNEALYPDGRPQLVNRAAGAQLLAAFEEATSVLKRALVHLILAEPQRSFTELFDQLQAAVDEADLSSVCWEVRFQDAMGVIAAWLASYFGEQPVVAAIGQAESVESLVGLFKECGVDLDFDPDACSRRNSSEWVSISEGVERLRVAWFLRELKTDPQSELAVSAMVELGRLFLQKSGFCLVWSEGQVLKVLAECKHLQAQPIFLAALLSADNVADLQARLALGRDDLVTAEQRLKELRSRQESKKRFVTVCGEEFDASEDNRSKLFDLVVRRAGDVAQTSSLALDLSHPQSPAKATPSRIQSKRPTPSSRTRTTTRRSSQIDEVVGLAGEIFVYLMLRNKYGKDVICPSAWKSSNSRHVFPGNGADDGHGCDFSFTIGARRYRVEVKATSGEEEVFSFGSSEIQLATSIGTRSRKRGESYLVMHVKNALSEQPNVAVLPNPFDPKFSSMYVVEEAESRVRYKSKAKSK